MAGYRTGKLDLLESHSKTLMNEAEKYHSYMVETIRVIDTMAGYVNDYSTELRLRQLEERIYQTIQNIPQRYSNLTSKISNYIYETKENLYTMFDQIDSLDNDIDNIIDYFRVQNG